jgi:hypothetical protein
LFFVCLLIFDCPFACFLFVCFLFAYFLFVCVLVFVCLLLFVCLFLFVCFSFVCLLVVDVYLIICWTKSLHVRIFQHDPRDNLDFSGHACRRVSVSFAVVNEQGPSQFSEAVTLDVRGGEQNWEIRFKSIITRVYVGM